MLNHHDNDGFELNQIFNSSVYRRLSQHHKPHRKQSVRVKSSERGSHLMLRSSSPMRPIHLSGKFSSSHVLTSFCQLEGTPSCIMKSSGAFGRGQNSVKYLPFNIFKYEIPSTFSSLNNNSIPPASPIPARICGVQQFLN